MIGGRSSSSSTQIQIIRPGEFEPHNHWYQKALHATIHPMVKFFMKLSQERMISRYVHLHPLVDPKALHDLLNYRCRHFVWSGADLLNVTSLGGRRHMVLIENNSCPSGQKSMPVGYDYGEITGYHLLMDQTFRHSLKNLRNKIDGGLAVLYDKNYMESSGYAHAMADSMQEPVFLVPFYDNGEHDHVRFLDGVMWIRELSHQPDTLHSSPNSPNPSEAHDTSDDVSHQPNSPNLSDSWIPIRACYRYLTQRPWNRVPMQLRTRMINPIHACLAGGRNKLVAAKAYDLFNSELEASGLHIHTPETIWEVQKNEIPLWVQKMGGRAVIKVPYSNAGQGVYTIVSTRDLADFMAEDHPYDMFIVQSLIGNAAWSSTTQKGKFYHVGTIPNKHNQTYVADIRMMIASTSEGIKPICTYARRARMPLADSVDEGAASWDMLGTNLSYKEDGAWQSDTNRLILMDGKDFNQLGIGLDDLIEAYIQSVLSMIAIDKMASHLTTKSGAFRMRLFQSLNDDPVLMAEIAGANGASSKKGSG